MASGRGLISLDRGSVENKNFQVVLRIRPPLPRELESERNYQEIVRTEGSKVCSINENPDDGNNVYNTHRFTFDRVYDQDATQEEIYKQTAREAVVSTLQGYNATVLAYGQTGTGKTFSMEGFDSRELRGIIPRSVEDIFYYIQNTADVSARFLVRASYLQIYNEVICDLLKPERTNLAIREDKKKGVFVEGLSEWVVRSPHEVYGLIKRGSGVRATGSTKINEVSSRSHALFILIVEQNEISMKEQGDQAENQDGGDFQQSFKVGKLNLVDLAGSERVRVSGASGKRLEETKKINQSLSALGNVIAALTDKGTTNRRQHVPYRDSKLTRILEDSLGGNCKTTMMAMISPAMESFQESLSTLKFANRAKNIKNDAVVNEDLDEKALLRRYERELKKLRGELEARSRNVVDKRKMIELEEQKRRAEEDKLKALNHMEQLSHDLMVEKNQKMKLEERIKEMSSQLLVGGHQIQEMPAFKIAVKQEQERIRRAYQLKVNELEKERQVIEEEKAQTFRYKQLLLKQRDIMIQLTARLNERDQSILHLQEELDAYDSHQRMMEDALDQKTAVLISLQKQTMEGDDEDTANGATRVNRTPNEGNSAQIAELLRQKEEESNGLKQKLSDSEAERGKLEQFLREQFEARVEAEVASRLRKDAQGVNTAVLQRERAKYDQHYSHTVNMLQTQLEAKNREAAALSVDLTRMQTLGGSSRGSEVLGPDMRAKDNIIQSLQEQVRVLMSNAAVTGGEDVAQYKASVNQYREALSSLKKKYVVQNKERSALKIILEKKMKTLVDSIAQTTLTEDGGGSNVLPTRTKREIQVLQRLVDASLMALEQSDAPSSPSIPSS